MSTITLERPLQFHRILAMLAMIVGLLAVLSPPVSAAGLTVRDVQGVVRHGDRFGSFEGVVQIRSFELVEVGDGFVLAVNGLLRGTVTKAGGATQEIRETFTAPVALINPGPDGVCQILELDIGPIHLEVLGLIIDLSDIHLDVTADPAGGLLGDLLCSLADALDNLATLQRIQRLVRRINEILETL